MKRFLSTILTLAMLMSLFTVFAVTSVAAVTEISNTSPAITANVGEKIDLSGYSVVFDGDSTATTGITWKDASGTTVEEITPSAKGVTKLTATSGSKSKTIYLVAKNETDTEYVLYEANMSDFASIDAMKTAGWVFTDSASYYSLSDGALVMGNLNDDYVRAILPSWLGDFGDYAITSDVKMLTSVNDGRWFGLVYRIQNANGSYYPYTHMCVRENTVNSGIEFAERTSGDAWNVVLKGSGDISSLKSAYNTFKVEAKGKNIKYSINNSQVIYATEDYIGTSVSSTSAAYYSKGMLGLTVNYATVAFKNIKITVQENDPVKEAKKLDLINIDHDELNLINPIANVERLSDLSVLDAEDAPNSVYRNANLIEDMPAFLKKCMENSILPILYINSSDDVTKVVEGMNSVGCKDVTVLATNAEHLANIRAQKAIVRTGLIIGNPTSYATVHDLRVAVRSAPATLCVIPSAYATKELVSEIQEYAVAVWAAIPNECENLELEAITAITAGVNGVISDDASVVTESINTHLVENAMTRTPIMIGHRGNPTQAPENTLSGYIEAYENGADVFEVDVEITSDGEIIIMHDSTLNRTTTYTGTKSVNQMTLAEVKQYYVLGLDGAATDEKVPTLKEVCDYFKDKDCKIFVEFKGSNANNVPVTLSLLDTYGMDYLVDVISFNSSFLTQTQANSTGMSTGYLLSSQSNGTTWEDALTSLNIYLGNAQSVNSTINPACGIVLSAGNYFTQAATDRGMTVWPWTYSYSSNDIGFFSGCDGVTTDDVQWCYNMSKLLKADDFQMVVGQTYAGGNVISEAYGNHESVISIKDTVYSVITGEENVAVVDGKLVALKEGTAKVVFGYVTATATGREYVTYTQPVTITVGAGDAATVENLLTICENVSVADYTTADIRAIRDLYNEIKAADIASLSEEEINEYIVTLSALLGNTVSETILSTGKNYERTEPNRGAGNAYNDDAVRLTDGIKGTYDGGTSKYSGWSYGVSPEITVDLGEVTKSNTYRVYTCDGNWGISLPGRLTVSVSEDGETFTTVGATTKCTTMNKITDSWCTYVMTVELDEAVDARYIRFAVTNSANHVWMDEVEVSYVTARSAAETGIYVTGINEYITSGQTSIFTPDFGEITTQTANHAWTANIIAEWDDELKAYKVIEAFHGDGTSTPDVTLEEGQIFIASHKWDIYDTTENPFIGSKLNCDNAYNICVGDLLIPEGIDVSTETLSVVAPHFSISHTHAESSNTICNGDKTCTLCGDILAVAVPHNKGEWKTLDDGSQELRCTICETLLDSKPAPSDEPETATYALGDINMDGTVNQYDYILAKRAHFNTITFNENQKLLGDMDEDGDNDQYDYILIKRIHFKNYSTDKTVEIVVE